MTSSPAAEMKAFAKDWTAATSFGSLWYVKKDMVGCGVMWKQSLGV
jgi:hypothetical protein